MVVSESAVCRNFTHAPFNERIIRAMTPGTPVIRSPIAVTLQHSGVIVYA